MLVSFHSYHLKLLQLKVWRICSEVFDFVMKFGKLQLKLMFLKNSLRQHLWSLMVKVELELQKCILENYI